MCRFCGVLGGDYGAFCLLLVGKFYFVGCSGLVVIGVSLLGFLWAFGCCIGLLV